MLAALEAEGLSPTLSQDGCTIVFGRGESLNCRTGQAQLSQNRTAAEIKRAYSTQVLKQTAKARGWQLQNVAGQQGKFVVNKR